MTNTAATQTTITSTGPVLISPRLSKDGRQYGIDVETLDMSVSLIFRSHDYTGRGFDRDYYKTARVFGALSAFVPGFDAEETWLYAAITDHDSKDAALAKFHRASKKAAKVELLAALPALFDALRAAGHDVREPAVPTAKFSIKAGCSLCPCSPGFVLDARILVDGRPVDLHFS